MPNRFDALQHKYHINEIEVPSITQLLPKKDFHVSPERLEETRQEGIENHSLIKMYHDTGETFNNPMLEALEQWLKGQNFGKLLCYEQPLYSEKLMFAGTPDSIYENVIIDYKRNPGNSKIHALQIAGQQILAVENKIISHCKKWRIAWFDGKEFKSRNVYNPQAVEIFKALIQKHKIEQAINNYLKI